MNIIKRKGVVLIASYLVILVLLILLIAFVAYSFTESKAARKYHMTTTALYLAEAGVDAAINALKYEVWKDREAIWTFGSGSGQEKIGYWGFGIDNFYALMEVSLFADDFMNLLVGSVVYKSNFTPLSELGGYEYTITLMNKLKDKIYPQYEYGIFKVESTSYIPSNDPNAPDYQRKKIETFAKVVGNLFSSAMAIGGDINLTDSIIDSYDSSKGPYSSQQRRTDGTIIARNMGLRGEGPNPYSRYSIELNGRTTVYGDAMVSKDVSVDEAIKFGSNDAIITGNKMNYQGNFDTLLYSTWGSPLYSEENIKQNLIGKTVDQSTYYTLQPISQNLSDPKSFDRLVFNNMVTMYDAFGNWMWNVTDKRTYPGGTYLIQRISIAGEGSIEFLGPSMIYVTHADINIGGKGIITAGDDPKNLIIKIMGPPKMTIDTGTKFYGCIYAPITDVEINNTEFFGSIVAGGRAKVTNSKIHYDEALSNLPFGYNPQVSLIGWRELN